MKKALKIIGAIFLILGVIALVVCLCVIPYETNEFFAVVFSYLDKPIVLCGVSITIGGILLFFIVRYILRNTSVGSKRLNDLADKLELYKESEKKLNEIKDKAINECFNQVNKRVDDLENGLNLEYKALSLIPNKKVQEALNNGKQEKNN